MYWTCSLFCIVTGLFSFNFVQLVAGSMILSVCSLLQSLNFECRRAVHRNEGKRLIMVVGGPRGARACIWSKARATKRLALSLSQPQERSNEQNAAHSNPVGSFIKPL